MKSKKVRFVICALVSVLGTLLVTLIVLGHQDSKYNVERDDLYTSFKQDGVLYDILLRTGKRISIPSGYYNLPTFISLSLNGYFRFGLKLKMLILENTTFRPDTLYSMRQAFESESINESLNMTQLKPGKYHCMLFPFSSFIVIV